MKIIFTGEATFCRVPAGFKWDELQGLEAKKLKLENVSFPIESSYGSLCDDFCATCIPPAGVLGPKKKSFEFWSLEMSRSGLTPLMSLSIVFSVKHSTRVFR